MDSEEHREWLGKFEGKIISSIIILPIVIWIWPEVLPFGLFEFWNYRGTILEWLYASWPIFAWGVGATIVLLLFKRDYYYANGPAEDILVGGALVSLQAGILEEITFRWLFFLENIVSLKIANFLFFGFLGFGIPSWFHINISGPVASWTSLGGLDKYVFHDTGWAVGAAMLATNAFFRDGHRYQGMTGVINSWFIGMFFFWIMFKFGLPAAIMVHFLYDIFIFIVVYVYVVIGRALGRA
ncbi:MAG: CPBP family glutamic-type intramembrane protease [bacterium]|nr:CPBP family glutamic-type intramembrane protease [bacterium]